MANNLNPHVLLNYETLSLPVSPERGLLMQTAAQRIGEIGLAGKNTVELKELEGDNFNVVEMSFRDYDAAAAFLNSLERLSSQREAA